MQEHLPEPPRDPLRYPLGTDSPQPLPSPQGCCVTARSLGTATYCEKVSCKDLLIQ